MRLSSSLFRKFINEEFLRYISNFNLFEPNAESSELFYQHKIDESIVTYLDFVILNYVYIYIYIIMLIESL